MAAASFPASRQLRIGLLLFGAALLVLLAGYYWFLNDDYAVLARDVRPDQAAGIVDELKKQSVSYELKDGGTTILVPAKDADAARLDVSTGDLPLKGTVGFELFNQSDMGLTDFAQKVNYQRALQGEIARTIMSMDGIAYARVHLALPDHSLFRANQSEPRAAVTLTAEPGVDIDPQRIAGIQRLVAAAVPDLALDQVAILNGRGDLLTPEFTDLPTAASSQSALESNYLERVERVIAEVAPRAHVEAKVTVVQDGAFAAGAEGAGAGRRGHAIRIVLFEGSPLGAAAEQALRSAITADLGLESEAGDELSFSPAPQVASAMPAAFPPAGGPAVSRPDAREARQERFMAELARGWAVALSLLAAVALLVAAAAARRRGRRRRLALVQSIRKHLLPAEQAADAA